MSEFEYAVLFNSHAQTAGASLANFIAIVSGMVIASYFAAHKIDKFSMVSALIIYSLFVLIVGNEIVQVYSDFARLGNQIETRFGSLPNSDLAWIGPIAVGAKGLKALPIVMGFALVFSYLSSMFFFYRRRQKLLSSPQETLNKET